jgi:hypothetical protein
LIQRSLSAAEERWRNQESERVEEERSRWQEEESQRRIEEDEERQRLIEKQKVAEETAKRAKEEQKRALEIAQWRAEQDAIRAEQEAKEQAARLKKEEALQPKRQEMAARRKKAVEQVRANDTPAAKRKRRIGWIVAAGVGLTLSLASKYLPNSGVEELFKDLFDRQAEQSVTAPETNPQPNAEQVSDGAGGKADSEGQ